MMVISRTPFRVSLFGGGTDYPEYFRKHGGCTLSATMNKYCYISVCSLQAFLDYRIRVSYSQTELVNNVDEINHPSVRECLKFLDITAGVEIHHTSDLPARTGLGSSSCFTVGLLNALHQYLGEDANAEQLAEEAVHIERNLIGERVGYQDQYTCAYGGLLHLAFRQDMTVGVRSVAIPSKSKEALQSHLLLYYTGLQRSAHEVLQQQMERTKSGELSDQLDILADMVPAALDVLCNGGEVSSVGEMLDAGWQIKRTLSTEVSNGLIDRCYERARDAGAVGGKLMGAGAGGFLLLFVEPEHQQRVRDAMTGFHEVAFDFDDRGSQIVFSDP